jgi:hypothetical protein
VYENTPTFQPPLGLQLNVTEITVNALRFTFTPTKIGPGVINLRIDARRTTIGMIYPVFLIVAFWIITLALGTLGLAIIVHEYRRVEAGVILLFSGSLFAVPSLRNTAPLSPPFGCTLDYSSFFWCMLTCVIGFSCITVRYILQSKYPAFPVRAILPAAETR